MKDFKLISKEKVTSDVFHMIFETSEIVCMLPGQFVTFILPKIGGRAYSILKQKDNIIELIIKRLENGRGGSKFICDINPGDILKGVGPAGKFLLQENNNNKLFIGTGTGLVPLYNQIEFCINKKIPIKIKLLFGVRHKEDLFFIETLNKWKQENQNFDFEIYLSRDDSEEYNRGYVTNYINSNNISDYKEFYICGMPQMVDSVVEKLSESDVNSESIYTEKY